MKFFSPVIKRNFEKGFKSNFKTEKYKAKVIIKEKRNNKELLNFEATWND